jgi:hypothetical protein
MAKQLTCPQCGKLFQSWRKKQFCSERCRKMAENVRLRGLKADSGAMIPEAEKTENLDEQNQELARGVRGDEALRWEACNEVTRKLTRGREAIGWAMLVEGHGWFGRIGEVFSFGPSTRSRAERAVEARIRGEPFEKADDENTWRGTCWKLLSGST